MGEQLIATIMAFGGNFNPRDWEKCHGQLLSVAENPALYSLLGTTYGGDGRSTFALPDLRGRCGIGDGTGLGCTTRYQGQAGGYETVPLSIAQIPAHAHPLADAEISGNVTCTLHAENADSNQSSAQGNMLANQGDRIDASTKVYSGNTNAVVDMNSAAVTASHSLTVSGDTTEVGGDAQHENMPPWLCLNYIIAVDGIYPPRS
jgi:microcystin-dependent protein